MALPLTTKILLASAIAGGAAVLIWTNPSEGVIEYIYVDRVVENPKVYQGRTIKVHGTVVPGTVRQKVGEAGDYTFTIEREGHSLDVHFTNMVPDTFQEGGEVVLTGRLHEKGRLFESSEMAAKCPSKYQEELKVEP